MNRNALINLLLIITYNLILNIFYFYNFFFRIYLYKVIYTRCKKKIKFLLDFSFFISLTYYRKFNFTFLSQLIDLPKLVGSKQSDRFLTSLMSLNQQYPLEFFFVTMFNAVQHQQKYEVHCFYDTQLK